jgi:hypothetical protein
MRWLAALLPFAVFLAPPAPAAGGRVVHLTLPHELHEGETAILEVTLGRPASRAPIEVRTAAGRLLGAVSTLGVPRGRDAGTYLVPIPNDAFTNGRISLRLSIGAERRSPTREEVKEVKLTIRPNDP